MPEDQQAWAEDSDERFTQIRAALNRTLGQPLDTEPPQLAATLKADGVPPVGVVMVDPADPAWVAGLALAAGRVQVLIRGEAKGNINAQMSGGRAEGIDAEFREACDSAGLTWNELGDEIDAITVAMTVPSKVGSDDDGPLALTDVLGRAPGSADRRWAIAGLVAGDAPSTLYRAMCGLFLVLESAWLFDGYPDTSGWRAYDLTEAGAALEAGGYSVTLFDTPNQSADAWRAAVAPGVSADLIMVNTMGNADRLSLTPGRVRATGVPVLHRPAAVSFVHSFSAQSPGARNTIAGRFFDHGAYAYFGSVDEPFLSAFVPSPEVAKRMAGGAGMALSCRAVRGRVWKLNYFGDPLLVLRANTRAGTRISADAFESPGIESLRTEVAERLKAEDFAGGLRSLVLSGRDDEAARLAGAVLVQRPDAVGNELAAQMIMPLYRAGRFADVVRTAERLSASEMADTIVADAVWHAAAGATEPGLVVSTALLPLLRPGHLDDDAIQLGQMVRAREGAEAAAAVLSAALPRIENGRARGQVQRELDKLSR